MRITGILSQKNESAEDVGDSAKYIVEESGCDIPDIALDHTHRIGKNDPSGKNVRLITVRITTFRHRTVFYRARKNLSKNGVHLDLTQPAQRCRKDIVKTSYFWLQRRLRLV